MNKTPILVLAYNRPDTLRRTMDSIAACDNSEQYCVYVYVDAPNIYKQDDVVKHKEVMAVLSEYDDKFYGYKIKESGFHQGLAKSVINGVNEVISVNGKIIVIEDDLLLSYDCLDYLENALDFYEKNPKVWSVTGYCPPLEGLRDYDKSVFWTYRGCSYVWGSWKDRWDKVDWEVSDYETLINNIDSQKKFCRGGYDLPIMLKQQMEGFIDSWAIRWCFAQSKYDMMTVYPVQNRVYHLGFFDGTHLNRSFPQTELLKNYPEYVFEENIDNEIMEEYKLLHGVSWFECKKYFENFNDNGRFESMFNVMHLWKQINESGHTIDEYFSNRGYKTIAIYGMGKIGEHIEKELGNSNISVRYFIDRNKEICDGDRCISPDDDLLECDCIVITVTLKVEYIRKLLRDRFNGIIISIIDVLKDR